MDDYDVTIFDCRGNVLSRFVVNGFSTAISRIVELVKNSTNTYSIKRVGGE